MSKVRIQEPELFSAFWSVWLPIARRNDGRGLARETYRKHILNGVEPQDIVDGASWYVRSLTERDKEYVPLSSTWLNRQCYEDLCDKERDFQRRSAELASKPSNITTFPKGQTAFLRQQKQG